MIQPGNWRGHVMQVTHHKTYNTTLKKIAVPVWYRPNLPEPVPAQIPPVPVPDRNSGRVLVVTFIFCLLEDRPKNTIKDSA